MGVIHFEQEFTTAVAPSRMFKALILDARNLLPTLMPQSVKNIEFIEGNGEVGSIKLTTFPEGSPFKYVKHRIDVLDKENFMCKYTMIEGDMLGDKLKSIVNETKFEASSDGGSICKVICEFHAKEGHELDEESIKRGQEKALGLYKVVETHLLENPNLYA